LLARKVFKKVISEIKGFWETPRFKLEIEKRTIYDVLLVDFAWAIKGLNRSIKEFPNDSNGILESREHMRSAETELIVAYEQMGAKGSGATRSRLKALDKCEVFLRNALMLLG